MKGIYSVLFGAALGASAIFIHSLYPPIGLIISLIATGIGIWATGRLWGKRTYKFIASIAWALVVLRAGFPGLNEEYLIQGDAIGTSLINFGFIAIVIAIVSPL
ncbi:MAG: hypothetical protein RLZ20_269 [Actinomycetota bacterium]|jgi:hypothetical protein